MLKRKLLVAIISKYKRKVIRECRAEHLRAWFHEKGETWKVGKCGFLAYLKLKASIKDFLTMVNMIEKSIKSTDKFDSGFPSTFDRLIRNVLHDSRDHCNVPSEKGTDWIII